MAGSDSRPAGPGRRVCIHGHFYQPPRENPWLEAVERQDSAYPYHDWNERITAECYAPNAVSRILDGRGRITRILNNYSRISFNVGPTLLAWLEAAAPETYDAILEADRLGRRRFGGHGPALGQVYNHMIMPLANERDRRTQVRWGIRDFEHRFERRPEGMWLPETAADTASLEALAAEGIRFTILAPHQAARVRPLGVTAGNGGRGGSGDGVAARKWQDVGGGRVDPTRAYACRLPSGREMALFFYDGPISRAVAFENVLADGGHFASRLMSGFSETREAPQLVHIATDGETYGHHHRHGEMALSYALDAIDDREDVELTAYGEFLEACPPAQEAAVVENSSWSCAHGIERWRSDCGCSTGGEPGWNQAWRAPLREALDWIRDRLAPFYEERAGALFRDPWEARDAYVDVVLDRSPERVARFFEEHAGTVPEGARRTEALRLLELQRHAMLMYTSCGWFFTDLSGIETVQVLQYAGRVVQLGEALGAGELEPELLGRLEAAHSNVAEQGSGRRIYERSVRPNVATLGKVCGHFAVSSLFEDAPDEANVYCYRVRRRDEDRRRAGRAQLLAGVADVVSEITGESGAFAYAALHFGDHNVQVGVRPFRGEGPAERLGAELAAVFERVDFPAAVRLLDDQFGEGVYSLESLFRDQQRAVLNRLLESTLAEVEGVYRQVYDHHAPLMRFVAALDIPQPRALEMAAEFVLNAQLRRLFSGDGEPDFERARDLLEGARAEGVALDAAGLGFALRLCLERIARRVLESPGRVEWLALLRQGVELAREAPFEVNLWGVQNLFWELRRRVYPRFRARLEQVKNGDRGKAAVGGAGQADGANAGATAVERASSEDEAAREWLGHFLALAEDLSVAVETQVMPAAASAPP